MAYMWNLKNESNELSYRAESDSESAEGKGWQGGMNQEFEIHTHTNMCVCSVVSQLFASPWTVARQAPLSPGFSRLEHWGGLSFPPPGDLPDPGIKPSFLHCRQILYH